MLIKIILVVVVLFFVWHISTTITHHQHVTGELGKINEKMLEMEGAVKPGDN